MRSEVGPGLFMFGSDARFHGSQLRFSTLASCRRDSLVAVRLSATASRDRSRFYSLVPFHGRFSMLSSSPWCPAPWFFSGPTDEEKRPSPRTAHERPPPSLFPRFYHVYFLFCFPSRLSEPRFLAGRVLPSYSHSLVPSLLKPPPYAGSSSLLINSSAAM